MGVNEFIIIIIQLILTGLSYMLIPILLTPSLKKHKAFTQKDVLTYAIANSVCIKGLFWIITFPQFGSIAPPIIWGFVAYNYMKSKLKPEHKPEPQATPETGAAIDNTALAETQDFTAPQPEPQSRKIKVKAVLKSKPEQQQDISKQPEEQQPVKNIEPEQKKSNKKSKIIIPILRVLSVAMFVYTINLKSQLDTANMQLDELNSDYAKLEKSLTDKETQISRLKDQVDSYRLAVVFVNERYKFKVDGRYHYITCDKVLEGRASSYTEKWNAHDDGPIKICDCDIDYVFDFQDKESLLAKLP